MTAKRRRKRKKMFSLSPQCLRSENQGLVRRVSQMPTMFLQRIKSWSQSRVSFALALVHILLCDLCTAYFVRELERGRKGLSRDNYCFDFTSHYWKFLRGERAVKRKTTKNAKCFATVMKGMSPPVGTFLGMYITGYTCTGIHMAWI